MDVALFIPCYVDQLRPEVGLATVTLLERHGVTVHYPEGQTCCGQPLVNSGARDAAVPVARRLLELFEHHQHVVCPSGSCTSMVRLHYPELLGDAARGLAARTFELCEFLHDVVGARPRGRFPHRVGLHQSCHGLRELRLAAGSERQVPWFDKLRALLTGIEGLQLVDLQRPDECCGFGGLFSLGEQAVSCAMGQSRLADHERAGAEVIVAADQSCLMHLDGLVRRAGKPLRTLHLAELLVEAGA